MNYTSPTFFLKGENFHLLCIFAYMGIDIYIKKTTTKKTTGGPEGVSLSFVRNKKKALPGGGDSSKKKSMSGKTCLLSL